MGLPSTIFVGRGKWIGWFTDERGFALPENQGARGIRESHLPRCRGLPTLCLGVGLTRPRILIPNYECTIRSTRGKLVPPATSVPHRSTASLAWCQGHIARMCYPCPLSSAPEMRYLVAGMVGPAKGTGEDWSPLVPTSISHDKREASAKQGNQRTKGADCAERASAARMKTRVAQPVPISGLPSRRSQTERHHR